jgi:hypothetical protein
MNQFFNTGTRRSRPQMNAGRRPEPIPRSAAARPARAARACLAEPLEERVLFAMAHAAGGSGYSANLSKNSVIRQQQLICDPAEPVQGSTSVQYDADKVTLSAFAYGPGYGPLGNSIGVVEVEKDGKRSLQNINAFLDAPAGKETGFAQVFYQRFGQTGQITPQRTFTVVDDTGVEGVDTHTFLFSLLPAVQDDVVTRYIVYADAGTHSGNPPDFFVLPDGTRMEAGELLPAVASSVPSNGSVFGTAYEDVDADGTYNAGDKPLAGVTVFVDLDRNGKLDDGEPNQVTVDDGTYLFRTLRPGTYEVREITPEGFLGQMSMPKEGFNLVQVVAGHRSRFVDFGNLRPGTVSGVVFNDVNGDGMQGRSEIGGVAGALVYVDLDRNGFRGPGEPFAVSTAPAGEWSIGGLAPGTYVIRQVPPAGYTQTAPASFNVVTLSGSGDSLTGVTFGDHAVGPRVTGVYVLGNTWSGNFMSALGTSAQGDANGYLIDPATQARAIPWTSFDDISIQFDGPTIIEAGDLTVQGVGLLGGAVTYELTNFSYDATTRTARWQLVRPPASDRLTLTLDADKGGVLGASGLPLDGEWANGNDRYPSGDGSAGGDFVFGVNVLAGDVNGDGSVNALDLGQIKARLNRTTANPGEGNTAYSVFADLNADSRINALDLGAAKTRLNRRLPRILLPPPVIVTGTPVMTASVSSVTREVFSDQPLLGTM